MTSKSEKRLSAGRRSLLPLSRQYSPLSSPNPSVSSSASSRSRPTSLPATNARQTHSRSRSWFATLFQPLIRTETTTPTKDAPEPSSSRGVQQPSESPVKHVVQPQSAMKVSRHAKENEKPLPPLPRVLSPVAEEAERMSSQPMPTSSTFTSLPPQRDLQRLASWDWSGDDGVAELSTTTRFRDSSDGSHQSAEEEVYSGENALSSRASQRTLQDVSRSPSPIPDAPDEQARGRRARFPLQHIEPAADHLDDPALSAPVVVEQPISFGNPFSADNPPSHDLSFVLPSRPPSSLSFIPNHPIASTARPPLTLDLDFPTSRKISTVSNSVYSESGRNSFADEEEPAPCTAGPTHLQSYFSPITPADLRTPLSGLAISADSPPVPKLPSPEATRMSTRQVSSSSSRSAATSQPSPLFDVHIFSSSNPPSVLSAASSTFDPPSPFLPRTSDSDENARCSTTSIRKKPLRPALSPTPSSSSGNALEQGTWREDWAIDARMSRYYPREKNREAQATEMRWEDGADEAYSRNAEVRRIMEHGTRELGRRRRERHQRYLDERKMLYSEEEHQVSFGAV